MFRVKTRRIKSIFDTFRRNTSRRTGSRDINTVDDTTINSNDVNRYQQRRADISTFRNEFIRIDTRLAFSLLLQISHLIVPSCLLPDYSLSTACPVTFSGELFIAIPRRDRAPPSHSLSRCVCIVSLRKQFIRLFVFRPGAPRGLFRSLLLRSSPSYSATTSACSSKLFSDPTFVEHTAGLNKA